MMAEPTNPLPEQSEVEVPATDAMIIADLHKQLEEKHNAYVRVLADFQNFQRRSRENETRAHDHGMTHVARAIVPVLENMDLALGHNLRALPVEKLGDAVDLLRANLLNALSQCGIERIAPLVGDEFNPNIHEAVMQQPAVDVAPGHISQCLQAGYRFGDVPLRSAKVAVTPKPD
ncbi:MAG: nucleotide exchange factor GrpE [Phycisphaerales bacterium]|nr:nucleotide exchange factor GrpE [Phycisphaerales bacterium]